MTLDQRYSLILNYFKENVPIADSELHFGSDYELLVSVILSAQCTDKRVNLVTPDLFKAYPDVKALSKATAEDIYPYIKSVSYPNNKARNLAAMARKVMEDFGGKIPSDVDNLMKLPGAGRKTANVVASILYNEPVVAVDTHVFRVSRRLGLSRGTTPRAVELDLEKRIPLDIRPIAHHWLLLHGRYTCTAQRPKCDICPLKGWCKDFTSRTAQ
ncbi:MAG: endonuclease III [Bacteroidales bacterium]|nr:endonuclease III [Bacteroidales bacterium]